MQSYASVKKNFAGRVQVWREFVRSIEPELVVYA